MKDLIRKKVQETKSELVLAAVSEYFDEVGFEKPKMQDIAKAVGISVGALYKLFPSKDALFFAYITYQINLFYKTLEEATRFIDDPIEVLKIYIKLKITTFISKKKAIQDPILGDPLFFLKMNIHKENPAQPVYDFLSVQFEKLSQTMTLKKIAPMQLAYIFNGHIIAYIEYWINFDGELESKEDEMLATFLEGIKEPPCR
jgi:AcrR family transcriptional regulator